MEADTDPALSCKRAEHLHTDLKVAPADIEKSLPMRAESMGPTTGAALTGAGVDCCVDVILERLQDL